MKKLSTYIFLLLWSFPLLLKGAPNQANITNIQFKTYTSSHKKYKFSIQYPTSGWKIARDIKQQTRRSRFKDVFVLLTLNRVNQIRVSTYKALNSPNAKQVSRFLEAEFIRDEVRRSEQYYKIKDNKMKKKYITSSNSKEGWELAFSYWDRREGTLYSLYYIFYRKVVLPATRPGKPPLIIGRAYVVRAIIRKQDYRKHVKTILKIVKSFKFKLR